MLHGAAPAHQSVRGNDRYPVPSLYAYSGEFTSSAARDGGEENLPINFLPFPNIIA